MNDTVVSLIHKPDTLKSAADIHEGSSSLPDSHRLPEIALLNSYTGQKSYTCMYKIKSY